MLLARRNHLHRFKILLSVVLYLSHGFVKPSGKRGHHSSTPSGQEGLDVHQDLKVLSPTGEYVMPATHLPYGSAGPAVWTVQNEHELADVVHVLLSDHLQRRSRAHAASQGASRYAIGLVSCSFRKKQRSQNLHE